MSDSPALPGMSRFVWLEDPPVKTVKYSEDQPRVPAGNPEGGQWTGDPNAIAAEEKLAREAKEGIAAVSQHLEKAIEEAEYSIDEDSDYSWDSLSGEQQNEAEQLWKQAESESSDHYDTAWQAEREAMLEDLENEQEKIVERLEPVLARALEGKLTEQAELFDETLHLTLDQQSIEWTELDSSSLREEIAPDIDLDALRTVTGKELTDEQKEIVQNEWNLAWHEARKAWEEDGRDSGRWDEARSEAEWEAINDAWNELNDGEKLSFAQGHIENLRPEVALDGKEPSWAWEKSTDEGYAATGAVARELAALRTDELLTARGIEHPHGNVDGHGLAARTWDQWKSSSTSRVGLAFQYAAAQELGGVHRLTDDQVRSAILDAQAEFASKGERDGIGMERLQAYVRGQWETTQFVLEKTGTERIQTYRGLMFKPDDVEREVTELFDRNEDRPAGENAVHFYAKLSEASLKRSGAQSTTTDRTVANSWNGINWYGPGTRVVMRFDVPRTAAISLPAFGQNVQGEREVVLVGTRGQWKWDAWLRNAPELYTHPIKKLFMVRRGRRKFVLDIFAHDQGPHWLSSMPTKPENEVKYSEDQPRDEIGRWSDGGSAGPGSSARERLQEHLVDYRDDRELTGPDSMPISEMFTDGKFVGYLDVPGIDAMHEEMGVRPTLHTDAKEYAQTREKFFKAIPPTDVPIAKLTFTQPRVNRVRVQDMTQAPPAVLDKAVGVIKNGDRYFLIDGHHRVAGNYALGKATVKGHVFDATDKSKSFAQWFSPDVVLHMEFVARVTDESWRKYSESQPRVPAGDPAGGQWTSDGGGAAATASPRSGLLDQIRQPDGGFTLHTTSGKVPTKGFALSIYKGPETIIDADKLKLGDLVSFAQKNAGLLSQSDNYFGAWHNPQNGKVYLDVSKVLTDASKAEALGREHGQLAYYDFERGQSVDISPKKAA